MAKVKYLTREDILAADDIQVEEIVVPEWGGKVRVRGLSGTERDAFEATILDNKCNVTKKNIENLRAKLVSLSVVDEAGNRLFSDNDIVALGAKSARPVQRVFNIAQKLSGISEEDIEELTKNSESDQNVSSISGSPKKSDAQ